MSSFPGDWIWLKQPGSPSTVTGSQLVIHQTGNLPDCSAQVPRQKQTASKHCCSFFILPFLLWIKQLLCHPHWLGGLVKIFRERTVMWESWVLAEDICLSFPISSPSHALVLQWEEVSISDREAQGVMVLTNLTKTSSLRTDPPHQKRGWTVSPHSGSPSRVLVGGELTGEWTMGPLQHVEL